jgi:rsbT co-antagonist protein RsbR
MVANNHKLEAVQQENQQLREQVAALKRERDLWQQRSSNASAADTTAQMVEQHPLFSGPVILFRWVASEGWPVAYVSPNIDRLGYSADDFLTGRVPYPTIVYPDDLERVAAEVAQYTAEGRTSFEQDYRIVNAAGEVRWVYDYTTIVRDDQGAVTHYLGYLLDITERKQQESELNLTRFTIDNTVDQVYWIAPDGKIVYINNAACTSLGYTRDELLAMSIPDIDPHAPREKWPAIRERVQQAGSLTFESLHRCKDGTEFPVEIVASYLFFDNQDYICAFARDITARKQQESELRIFKELADNALDSIAMARLDNTITYANAAFQAMSGRGESVYGMSVEDLYPPDMLAYVEKHVAPVLIAEGAWQGELEIVRPDGKRLVAQNSLFTIRDETGQPVQMANLLRDITEQKHQEAERQLLQQQVIDAQRNALRELSTPLIPISDNVVIMPLIGTIDSQRAQQIMEALLDGVAQHQASLVILDITGVSMVDTQVAQTFIQSAQAVRLLGAQVMLTGIQPQIAQTLVHLGVDLSGIITQGSLQAGIAAALRHTS